eukprot:TRINITY_DN33661_c0_g1_i1.p1 TRINITY_DN33661_c0_g1~~TRINITY_DN33661_c0_g1_i1.p1  ORF type:complete len:484 (-),score=62.68 TRINITY_DN33661_c0_g1_i1:31-1482(-)
MGLQSLLTLLRPSLPVILASSETSNGNDVYAQAEARSTCASNTDFEVPDTGSRIEVLWDIQAQWAPCTVTAINSETSEVTVMYNSGYEHQQTLGVGEWKLIDADVRDLVESEAEYDDIPVQTRDCAATLLGAGGVGSRILVHWPEYTEYHAGEVGPCNVQNRRVTSCQVMFDDMGDFHYDLRPGSGVQWRPLLQGTLLEQRELTTRELPRLAHFYNAPNFMEIDVPIDVVDDARRWYEAHVLPHVNSDQEVFHSMAFEGDGSRGVEGDLEFYRQFAGGKFGSDIKWISPSSMKGYNVMESFFNRLGIAQPIEQYIDTLNTTNTVETDGSLKFDNNLRVYIPSFVVRAAVRETYFHLDWPPEGGSNGLTFMTPLFDMSNVTSECNLMYRGEQDDEHVYKYNHGKGVLFGGSLYHSSQPCTREKAKPWAFLSFNFGTNKQAYWETISPYIQCGGKYVVQPNGEVAPPESCDSYNTAYKKETEEAS